MLSNGLHNRVRRTQAIPWSGQQGLTLKRLSPPIPTKIGIFLSSDYMRKVNKLPGEIATFEGTIEISGNGETVLFEDTQLPED